MQTTCTVILPLSAEILDEDDVLAQADLISSVKFSTLWIPGHVIFISVFSSMDAVPEQFIEDSVCRI